MCSTRILREKLHEKSKQISYRRIHGEINEKMSDGAATGKTVVESKGRMTK